MWLAIFISVFPLGLLFEKLRAGSNQCIHKPSAVSVCAAASLFTTVLYKVVVHALRLNDVKVVLATAGVNIGIAGVAFLLSFVTGF